MKMQAYYDYDVVKAESEAPAMMKRGLAKLRTLGFTPPSLRQFILFILQADDLLDASTSRKLCRAGAKIAGARPLDLEQVFSHYSGYHLFTLAQKERAKEVVIKEFVPYFIDHGQIPSDTAVVKRLNGIPGMVPRENLSELSVRIVF